MAGHSWGWQDGDFGLWVDESDDETPEIRVELDSPNGPRVIVPADAFDEGDSTELVLGALPHGWTVHVDDWSNGVRLADGSWSYPLSHPLVED